jgi:hypothetical protein
VRRIPLPDPLAVLLAWALGLAVVLVCGDAFGQGRVPQGGGGTACGLASSGAAFAASLRLTTTTGLVPSVQCDGVTASCVKYGPGNKVSCGTNVAGDFICGLAADSTGVYRFYGTVHAVSYSAVNVTATNVATVNIYQQTAAGYLDNPNGTAPLLVNDAQGFRVTCKTALTTCASTNEATVIPICGTGGAVTKQCLCTGDGTTYAWRNLLNPAAGAGTSTTCPAT